jgi:uracil-DNA glycosylase
MSFDNNPLQGVLSDNLRVGRGDASEQTKRTHRLNILAKGIRMSGCTSCRLHKERVQEQRPVPGLGEGRIMFVGHRVGIQETNSNEPAMGEVSHYGFTMFLEAIGRQTGHDFSAYNKRSREVILDYAYVTNAARCGGHEDVKVNASIWNKCGPQWLSQEVRAVDPALVVFWNKGVARSAIQGEVPDIGVIQTATVYGVERPCMVMYNPSSVARDASFLKVVESQFDTLVQWLQDNDLCVRDENAEVRPIDVEAEHVLVSTKAELNQAIDELMPYTWFGFDSETAFHGEYGKMTKQELSKGAVMWHAKEFDLVCAQICGLEPDGAVRKTYTLACGFRDRFTGQPSQELTVDDVVAGLDRLCSTAPTDEDGNPIDRTFCVWNAAFDGPVMARVGLDLLGLSDSGAYPLRIIDGMLVLARLNEHLGDIQQLSLDAAGKLYLNEGKGGGFSQHFDIQEFAYEPVNQSPAARDRVLAYTGEDPRKTLLVTKAILEDLRQHAVDEIKAHVSDAHTALPALGFGPYPKPGSTFSKSRMWDVAIPMDHQMLPIIAGMELVGFHLDLDKFVETETYVQRTERELKSLIQENRPWYNPNSTTHALRVIDEMFDELVAELVAAAGRILESAPSHLQMRALDELSRPFLNPLNQKTEPSKKWGDFKDKPKKAPPKTATQFFYPPVPDVTATPWGDETSHATAIRKERIAAITYGYDLGYGEIDAQQKTIEDKLFVYLEAGLRRASEALAELGIDDDIVADVARMVDVEGYQRFFERVFVFKQLNKKWSTYFVRFRRLADRDSIIHPYYGQRTVSGRFQGNFQNIPRGGPEDLEWIAKLMSALGRELPKDEAEARRVLDQNNKLDVRQYISALQPTELNRLFARFKGLTGVTADGEARPWRVNPADTYVAVLADFAAQEDRMAYALSGDKTKQKLLANPELDTHFYNVAFCFGQMHGYDTSTEAGVMEAYDHFTSEKKYKSMYRTPMKTVHYASQYGAAAAKLHSLLGPLFTKMGQPWDYDDTRQLKERYDKLYEGVTQTREALIDQLDRVPLVEFPVFGTVRHAKVDPVNKKVMKSEYLSVANALNQGSSAYITKAAMLRMRHLIEMNAERWDLVQVGGSNYVGIVLQVHDEIGVLCPAHLAEEVALCLESAMKIIVGPPNPNYVNEFGEPTAFWDTQTADHRGETGWLYIPDPAFRGVTLFDADAEVKVTIAKANVLSDGTPNVLASLDDEGSVATLVESHGGARINPQFPLTLARHGHAPVTF